MRARRARWRRRTYPHEAHDDERLEVEKDGHGRARLAHAHQVARDHLRFQVQVAVGALCVDDDHEDAAGHGADDGLLGVDVRSGNQALEGPAGSVGKAPDRDEGASGAAAYLALATADEAVVGDDRAKVHSDFGRSENERAGRCVDDRVGCKRGGGGKEKKLPLQVRMVRASASVLGPSRPFLVSTAPADGRWCATRKSGRAGTYRWSEMRRWMPRGQQLLPARDRG